MTRQLLTLRNFILFGQFIFLSSCFYSTKYLATYNIQSKDPVSNIKELSANLINKLAVENGLVKDSKYFETDTLGFFGRPYHYFKFWVVQHDDLYSIKLDYNGVYGSRKNPPYRDLLSNLTDSLTTNFILIDKDIKETNNAKTSKK